MNHHNHTDGGFATPIEIMGLLAVMLVAVVFLGYLGRLGSAGVQVTNAAQDGARAASLTDDPATGIAVAHTTVARTGLSRRCVGGPTATTRWKPSPLGTWPGGTVTVTVTCQVANESLTGVWTPGTRTVSVSDTQVIERFRR